jgi:phosphoribosylformylglycinamidine synthase
MGASIAVAEAARNIVCAGGEPLAVTNCLNFGNPYLPEVYWQFAGVIKGMGDACLALGTPVTGGNVSFYNQSNPKKEKAGVEQAVFPTPTIGMLGLMDGLHRQTGLGFQQEGDLIYLLGPETNDFAQSEYLVHVHGITASPAPFFDMDVELALQKLVFQLITEKMIASAHDVSEGGLFQCLAESAIASQIGFDVSLNSSIRVDAALFGEGQSRVVVTVEKDKHPAFESFLQTHNVNFLKLGETQGKNVTINGQVFMTLDEAILVHEITLPAMLDG